MNHEVMLVIVTISKGLQVTIPAEFRNAFGLRIGSRAEMVKEGNTIVIKPIDDDVEELFRQAKKLKPRYGFTAEQMNKEVENAIRRR